MCYIKTVSFTYSLENFTLNWIFYTTSGCDGCDKYQVWMSVQKIEELHIGWYCCLQWIPILHMQADLCKALAIAAWINGTWQQTKQARKPRRCASSKPRPTQCCNRVDTNYNMWCNAQMLLWGTYTFLVNIAHCSLLSKFFPIQRKLYFLILLDGSRVEKSQNWNIWLGQHF